MKPTTVMIIILALTVLFNFVVLSLGRKRGDLLLKALLSGNYDLFWQKIDEPVTKLVLDPFNRDYMKLNAAIMQENKEVAQKQLDILTKAHLNRRQKEAFYNRAFAYYITEEDKENAKVYLDLLNGICDENYQTHNNAVYDTQIEKGWKYLDQMLEREKAAEESELLACRVLIQQMYENKGDQFNSDIYQQKIEQMLVEINEKAKSSAN